MKMYNEIKVDRAVKFASTLHNMIKWSMFDERYIHFYQTDGVNEEIDIENFKTYTIGSRVSVFEFDGWVDEVEIDMHKPLFLIECNTQGRIWVIKPDKIKMTKLELANCLDFASEINVKNFCNMRTREQVINAYISNICSRF